MAYSDYNLVLAKGHSFDAPTASEVLRDVADFVDEDLRTLLAVNLTYNVEDGDYTAHVLYE